MERAKMALCKDAQYINHSNANSFDQVLDPGSISPVTGIYRCEGCGEEIVSEGGRMLPGSNHHPHVFNKGAIHWRVVVMTQGRKM
jgi:hypothetical protein